MMASGLPVVDLYRENNLYDIPDDGVLLADTSPEAVASAIIKILDDEKLQKQLSNAGYKFMQKYPIERGFNEFLKFVNVVSSGIEAKIVIKDGQVKVNGEVELRRGKKLHDQDEVEVNGEHYIINAYQ